MKVNIGGGITSERKRQRGYQRKVLSLEQMLELIDTLPLQAKLKEAVIAEVNHVPEGALDYFWNNIQNIIAGVQMSQGIVAPLPQQPMPWSQPEPDEMPLNPNIIRPQEPTTLPPAPQQRPQNVETNPAVLANKKFIEELKARGGFWDEPRKYDAEVD